MEPIERELADRRERLKRLVIELQRLEAIRPLGPREHWDEHDRSIIHLRYQIEHARYGIKEFEEIVSEKRSPPPKLSKPDVSRRRKLSAAERENIAAKARADLLARLPYADETEIRVEVERFTDLQGNPQVGIHMGTIPPRTPRSSGDF